MLDSSTISFLFQIFALALVSAGVYMLTRYHRSLAATEENARRIIQSREAIKEVVEDGISWSNTCGLVLAAFGVSCAVERIPKGDVKSISCVASIRESMRQVHSAIEQAVGSKRAMGVSQRDILLDQIVAIKNAVRRVGDASDVEKMCDDCAQALREGGFIERETERKKKLDSVWQ